MSKFLQPNQLHYRVKRVINKSMKLAALEETIKNNPIIIPQPLYKQLDDAFLFEHEIAFTLYEKKGIIENIKEYTDYEESISMLEQFPETLNIVSYIDAEKKRQNDSEYKNFNKHEYHTHSLSSDVKKRFLAKMNVFASKDYSSTPYHFNYPSYEDIEHWIGDTQNKGYILIGYKEKKEDPLDIKAFLPIASFAEYEYCEKTRRYGLHSIGNSALKQVKHDWYSDTAINSLTRLTWNLDHLLIKSSRQAKDASEITHQALFIEIPVKYVN